MLKETGTELAFQNEMNGGRSSFIANHVPCVQPRVAAAPGNTCLPKDGPEREEQKPSKMERQGNTALGLGTQRERQIH